MIFSLSLARERAGVRVVRVRSPHRTLLPIHSSWYIPRALSPLAAEGRDEGAVAVDASDALLGPLSALRRHPSLPPALHGAFDELRPVPPDAIERMSREDEVAAAVIRLWRVFESRSERYSDRLAVSREAGGVLRGSLLCSARG